MGGTTRTRSANIARESLMKQEWMGKQYRYIVLWILAQTHLNKVNGPLCPS